MLVDPELIARVTAIRRDLHRHPELRFEEHRTAHVIAAFLDEHQIPWVRSAGTGIVGRLGPDGPRGVVLRADMDALPISEVSGVDWASQTPGKMHACGHDGHVAMLLGAAAVLAADRASLGGSVHLVFQPAEEGGHGAREMVREGLWRGVRVDAAFALHNWPEMTYGTWSIRSGGVMAANDVLRVRILGRGGHAADPHLTVDPVHVAAQFLVAVQGLVSRATDAQEPVVVSFCTLRGSDATNVIPDVVELGGTLRTLSRGARERAPRQIQQILDGVCAAWGATGELIVDEGYPVTVNDPVVAEIAASVAAEMPGWIVRRDVPASMGSEDFAYFAEQVPAAYVWMGTGDERHPHVCHQARFDFNDRALEAGIAFLVGAAQRVLRAPSDGPDA